MSRQDNNIDDPQDIDLEDGDEPVFEECPICGKVLPESANRCHHCGRWLVGETTASARSSGWFWPVIVAILIGIILVIWNKL